ncbi:MAG TPA: sodium:proton antiporter [Lachnospiraceae bacterium]|nr:sodium:proton antiporter [Lachnospiraceae bacterium]
MEAFEWIRFIVGTAVILCGLFIFIVEVYGIFHLKYVMNRMHVAAMGDTLGISISLIGLMIFSGINFITLKMALIVVFLWFASPVSSHLIARLEVSTNDGIKKFCETGLGLSENGEVVQIEKEEERG